MLLLHLYSSHIPTHSLFCLIIGDLSNFQSKNQPHVLSRHLHSQYDTENAEKILWDSAAYQLIALAHKGDGGERLCGGKCQVCFGVCVSGLLCPTIPRWVFAEAEKIKVAQGVAGMRRTRI